MHLPDDAVARPLLDDPLDPLVLMTRHEQELRAVRANVLVDAERRRYLLGAVWIAALADEGEVLALGPPRALRDPLVHVAEERLGPSDPCLRFLHLVSRLNARGRVGVSPTIASVPSWPEPVERVASFLRESGAEARIEEFRVETPTAADAARAAGCDLAQIVKTVVFDCGDRFVVALTPGDRRADAGKVARAAKAERAKVARAAQVVEATGFEPGAVAPFPLPGVAAAFVDQTLLTLDKVWVGAGSTSHLATLSPAELVRLTHAEPGDFVERLPEPGGVSGPRQG